MDQLHSLIQELERGKKSANQMMTLVQQLQRSNNCDEHDVTPSSSSSSSNDYKEFDDHTMVVLSTFDNALSLLQSCDNNNNNIVDHFSTRARNVSNDCKFEEQSCVLTTPKDKRGSHKRRKIGQTTTIKDTSTLADDGFAWRKYGQKAILNTNHPRNYYRCTHKSDQGCQATKQVQQISENPTKYRLIYQGEHTCKNHQINNPFFLHNQQDSSILLSFVGTHPPKHALNPLILPSSPPSSSSCAMVKQEYYGSTKEHIQHGTHNIYSPSSDLTTTSTPFSDQGDVISSLIIDDQSFYSSVAELHGMDDDDYSYMMADHPIGLDVVMQGLCA